MKIMIIPVTPFQQNCSVLWDETSKLAAVVDPGGDVPRILEELDAIDAKVEKIVLTHGHVDHAAGATVLQLRLRERAGVSDGIPIEGPDRRDAFLLEGLEAQAAKYGFRDARNVTPDRWLAEGETVEMAGEVFQILHCPGHTPGSLVFASPARKFALVGDVLFKGSVGRTDFPYGDHAALIASIHEKLLPLGDDVSFLCGHGPASTIGAERQTNPFLRAD